MSIKLRLIIMNFLQFFIWGAWLISIGNYLGNTLQFSSIEIGSIFSTIGIASLFMPTLTGIIADKWMNAERVFALCHSLGAIFLFLAAQITDYQKFFSIMLFNSMVYMPTIALNNTVSYRILEQHHFDIIKTFPPLRVWGTIGFIIAMWTVDFSAWTATPKQLLLSASASLILSAYALTLPHCPPIKLKQTDSFLTLIGFDAFILLKQKRMFIFFLFAMLLGVALQITNAFGSLFLNSFNTTYPNSFAVKHANILLSISQISETLCILTVPFFLSRFGIKKVMMISIFAWVLRFGLFAIGNPEDGLISLILSMIVYGLAFDFFNISGSLFVEQEAPIHLRASAQGLLMLMSNGFGAIIGSYCSGLVVDYFTQDNIRDWTSIWFIFSLYTLILGLIFPCVFKDKQ